MKKGINVILVTLSLVLSSGLSVEAAPRNWNEPQIVPAGTAGQPSQLLPTIPPPSVEPPFMKKQREAPQCMTPYFPNRFGFEWPYFDDDDPSVYPSIYLCRYYNGPVQTCDEHVRQWQTYHWPLLFTEPTCPNDPPVSQGLMEDGDDYFFYTDQFYDRFVRPTSLSNPPGNILPGAIHPDILQYRIGAWYPFDPYGDLWQGEYDSEWGDYLRLDILLKEFHNPPGPTGGSAGFDPLRYGPNPVYGIVEFDMDHYVNTGGDLGNEINPMGRPQDSFLSNAGRFGFRAWGDPLYSQRQSMEWLHSDPFYNFFLQPYVKRSGNDYMWFIDGVSPMNDPAIEKRCYSPDLPCDDDDTFEPGEVWIFSGHFFCRGRGYAVQAFWDPLQGSPSGFYCPGPWFNPVQMAFSNDYVTHHTMISLLYPLTQSPMSENYLPSDSHSMTEALRGVNMAAYNYDMSALEDLIKDYRQQNSYVMLQPMSWNLRIMVGTTYNQESADGQMYVWTDNAPDHIPGDFSADEYINMTDTQMVYDFMVAHECNPNYDLDGICDNNSLTLPDTPKNFSTYDNNYDGVVNIYDVPVTPTPIQEPPPD